MTVGALGVPGEPGVANTGLGAASSMATNIDNATATANRPAPRTLVTRLTIQLFRQVHGWCHDTDQARTKIAAGSVPSNAGTGRTARRSRRNHPGLTPA